MSKDAPLRFLEIPRKDPRKILAKDRVRHYREIYGQYDAESAGKQAGRCLDCASAV